MEVLHHRGMVCLWKVHSVSAMTSKCSSRRWFLISINFLSDTRQVGKGANCCSFVYNFSDYPRNQAGIENPQLVNRFINSCVLIFNVLYPVSDVNWHFQWLFVIRKLDPSWESCLPMRPALAWIDSITVQYGYQLTLS